ncbi:hypothetical protein E2C01_096122 [Portunus trituberculatus]|uniref:Uncharacterized protein n=1 Tax=Portunus trituberculatus TaxID=210409 RepID=A0A5B7K282_PORTR|nr:hypothetical protein [Portunus trituberculatus]
MAGLHCQANPSLTTTTTTTTTITTTTIHTHINFKNIQCFVTGMLIEGGIKRWSCIWKLQWVHDGGW